MQQPARPMSIEHWYTSLYATPDGETHFRTVDSRLTPSEFAPPAQPLLVGEAHPASNCFFLAVPCGWGESDLVNGLRHPTPTRQFCTILSGYVVTYASDGTRVHPGPGDTLLLEDVAPARGHITVNPSTGQPCMLHIVQSTDVPAWCRSHRRPRRTRARDSRQPTAVVEAERPGDSGHQAAQDHATRTAGDHEPRYIGLLVDSGGARRSVHHD